ncbi:MAG: SDR family oxidoreductase [Alphaproteobacteria bacterium]|nr:SDR family oxidoreductase [Alphaproteobacteria bacterium]
MPLSPASLFDLDGQVALVTGSSRGLGWAIAQALAGAGALVVLNARGVDALAPRRDALVGAGLKAETMAFDAGDPAAATAAVAAIASRFGRLDILVNNAAGSVRKPALELTDEDWSRTIEASLTSGFRLARAAGRIMTRARYGRIVFTSSINSMVVRPGMVGYATAKTGMLGLVRSLAVEFAADGVTVNAIAPGYFPTEGNAATRRSDPGFEARIATRTPMGRWGRPEELGPACLYLCSRASSFTTGTVLTVDGGLTVAIGSEPT